MIIEDASIIVPAPQRLARLHFDDVDETVQDSYSVSAQGYGAVNGLTYTIPAHSEGNISAKIRYTCLTSVDVDNLNAFIRGMLSASQYEKIEEYEATRASAKLSFWSMFGGGGSASYEKTRHEMRGFGLSEENIRAIVNAMATVAQDMSEVKLSINVRNTHNDYAVSGSLLIYTLSGYVKANNQQHQYRMLANRGQYGSGSQTAPADVQVEDLTP